MDEPGPSRSMMSRASSAVLCLLLGAVLGVWVAQRLAAQLHEPRAARMEFADAGVALALPEGWNIYEAGGYALASPRDPKVSERILATSHSAMSGEGMQQVMAPLEREGPGGFYPSDEPRSACFNLAWAQRGEGESLRSYVVFRESGKLELRIESDGGIARLDELLARVRCVEPAAAEAGEPAPREPSLSITCRVTAPVVPEPAADPRCAHLARYYGDIHLAFDRLMREAPAAFGEMRFELTSDPGLLTTIASLVSSEMGAHPAFEQAVSVGVAKIPYLPAQFGETKLEIVIRVNLPEAK